MDNLAFLLLFFGPVLVSLVLAGFVLKRLAFSAKKTSPLGRATLYSLAATALFGVVCFVLNAAKAKGDSWGFSVVGVPFVTSWQMFAVFVFTWPMCAFGTCLHHTVKCRRSGETIPPLYPPLILVTGLFFPAAACLLIFSYLDNQLLWRFETGTATPTDFTKLIRSYKEGKSLRKYDAIGRYISNSKEFSPDVLAEIVRDFSRIEGFCVGVAHRSDATVELLDELSDHPYGAVRKAVIENPRTTGATLQKLYLKPASNFYDHDAIARHSNAPPDLVSTFLSEAVADQDPTKRRFAAWFPRAPSNIYSRLSVDTNTQVRLALAENERVPMEILKSLATDSSQNVGREALQTIEKVRQSRFASMASDFIRTNRSVVDFIGSTPELSRERFGSTLVTKAADGSVEGRFRFDVKASTCKDAGLQIDWRSKDYETDFQPLVIKETKLHGRVIWSAR